MSIIKNKNNRGFTLVELIVVLVILAILAAILVPALLSYIDEARRKKEILNAKNCFNAIQTELTKLYGDSNAKIGNDGNVVNELATQNPTSGSDLRITNTEFSKKVADKIDSEPYCVLFATGYYDKKNVSPRDAYTICYIFYVDTASSDPLYYYNGEWTKTNPRTGENQDIIKKEKIWINKATNEFTFYNTMQEGPFAGKVIRYYLLFDKTKKSWGDLWKWLKDMA